jgi:hypothetical protein
MAPAPHHPLVDLTRGNFPFVFSLTAPMPSFFNQQNHLRPALLPTQFRAQQTLWRDIDHAGSSCFQ